MLQIGSFFFSFSGEEVVKHCFSDIETKKVAFGVSVFDYEKHALTKPPPLLEQPALPTHPTPGPSEAPLKAGPSPASAVVARPLPHSGLTSDLLLEGASQPAF